MNSFCLSQLSVLGLEHDKVSKLAIKLREGLIQDHGGISSKHHLVRIFKKKVSQLSSLGSPSNFREYIFEKCSAFPTESIYRKNFFSSNKYKLSPL